MGRRRRVVKQQRGQTRIHHRKKTVSSGRRHKFFKRGGTIFNTYTSHRTGTYDPETSRYIPALQQINSDKKKTEAIAAADQAAIAEKEAAILNYPDVDVFVQKIKTTFVGQFLGDTVTFGIQKLPQKTFEYREVQSGERQNPVIRTINNKTVKFYVSFNGCNVNIYVDGTLYGRVQIITSNRTVIDTETLCSNKLANAIILDLKYDPPS